ncbi:MAG: FliM/FliN family flagellar motor switch protein [Candidatus Sericytochromatia bacterium]
MIQSNDFRYELNKPLMMADDDDDELFDDNDSAKETSSSSSDGDKASGGESVSERNSSGIKRSSTGFGVLALLGLMPISLLILYMVGGLGLSTSAMIFMVCAAVGFLLSMWTFAYYRKGDSSFNKFDVHSFFKWPEIIVISTLLFFISLYNIAGLSSGNAFSLSAQTTVNEKAKSPAPLYAPKPPSSNSFEENEVLYESKEHTPISGQASNKSTSVKSTSNITQKSTYTPPVAKVEPKKEVKAIEKTDDKKEIKTENKQENKNNKEQKATAPKAHEDEEGTSTSKGVKMDTAVNEAASIAEISGKSYSAIANKISSKSAIPMEIETTGIVSSLFLGGILCGALGYAFALAFAGGILGLFRKFNHPFAAKTKEIINEETGEITLETEAQSGGAKAIDAIFRFFIGFNLGGSVGFLLGLVITLPMYLLFWDRAQAEPLVGSFLTALGVVKNPDLAYGAGMAIAGFIVPVVMMVVGKSSPAGKSITEEEVRQIYSIPVTINKVSTEVATIPEPAIVSFNLDDSSERDGMLVDDFSDDDQESITQELAEEFGMDLEKTLGLKPMLTEKAHSGNGNGNGNGNGHHISDYEKQKINQVLENSLGELGNVSVQVSAELGKATIMLSDWLNLSEGMLIELDKPASQEIDILINDVCKGKGKITVVDNHLSVKVSKANFSQSAN